MTKTAVGNQTGMHHSPGEVFEGLWCLMSLHITDILEDFMRYSHIIVFAKF